jgi:hypothetical protein
MLLMTVRKRWILTFHIYWCHLGLRKRYLFMSQCLFSICGHRTVKVPHPVRSAKSSTVSPSQYCGGGPRGNPGCCSSIFFFLFFLDCIGLASFFLSKVIFDVKSFNVSNILNIGHMVNRMCICNTRRLNKMHFFRRLST